MAENAGSEGSPLDDLARIWDIFANKQDTDIILLAGPIYGGEAKHFNNIVRSHKHRKNVLLILSTFGGIPDCAFQIARCVQECYKNGKFTIFVPTYCKSAGTLITVAADSIVMSDDAELGPLDVQRLHRDVEDRLSGLTSSQALETLCGEVSRSFEKIFVHIRRQTLINSDTASHVAADIVSGLYNPIFGKLDPMSLGENERSMKVATEYGERLRKRSKNLTSQSLQRLVSSYPSHSFVIDRTEAEEIFQHLRSPSIIEEDLALLLMPIIDDGLFDAETNSVIDILDFAEHVERLKQSEKDNANTEIADTNTNREGESDGHSDNEEAEPGSENQSDKRGDGESSGGESPEI